MWKWGWNKEQAPDRLPLLTTAGVSPWCQQSQQCRQQRAAGSHPTPPGCFETLPAASSRGKELYLSRFKSVCFKDDLPHLTIPEFPKLGLRHCCCYLALCGAVPQCCRSRRLLSMHAGDPPALLPSAVLLLRVLVETWKASDWRDEAKPLPCLAGAASHHWVRTSLTAVFQKTWAAEFM